jgi:hypothetical protein
MATLKGAPSARDRVRPHSTPFTSLLSPPCLHTLLHSLKVSRQHVTEFDPTVTPVYISPLTTVLAHTFAFVEGASSARDRV